MQTEDQPQGAQPPAESQSIADRIAAKFGMTDEPEAPQDQAASPEEGGDAPNPEEVETPPEEELAEVEYEGERFQVPKKLEKAILQEKDYTQKSQTIAEKARQFEVLQEQGRVHQMRAQFEADSAQELAQLNAYDAVLNQKIDWQSLTTDQKLEALGNQKQWEKERDSLAKSLQEKYQKFAQQRDAVLKDVKSKAAEVISKKIPNWGDATVKEIREHAKSEGYTDVELSSMDLDPRHAATLYKAMQYDKLMAGKAKAVQTAKSAPPILKPGATRPMPQAVKNELAIKKAIKASTNSADKAKNIQKLLEGRF